jgi:ABC-type Fe3+/spermidine/putrescine transport system ATPase subunit
VSSELDRLLRSLGITTVYVTHDQGEAMVLGDCIVVMSNGAIAQIGTPREIYFEPASRFVAEFIVAANILEGHAADGTITLPGGTLAIADQAASGPVVAMVRPEAHPRRCRAAPPAARAKSKSPRRRLAAATLPIPSLPCASPGCRVPRPPA